MILQALNDYYQRKLADPDPARRLPVFGREEKEIPFIIELTAKGQLVGVKDTRTRVGKKLVATSYLVPMGVKRASGVAANLLWDTSEYVLGMVNAEKLKEAQATNKVESYQRRVGEAHAAFRARLKALPPDALADEGMQAVLAFMEAGAARQFVQWPEWNEVVASNPVMSFRLSTDTDLVCQRLAVMSGVGEQHDDSDEDEAQLESAACLVTGQQGPVVRLHTSIKGVWGAQSSGANIASFNRDAFNSFQKAQGANAPVGVVAAFAYTTALNHLLGRSSRQRMQVGDTSTVFWAQAAGDADMEAWFAELFKEADDPDARTEQIRALFEAVRTGRFDGGRGAAKFYVLGLAPNAARISVRFWHVASLSEIAQRTRQWFEDLQIARGPHDAEFPSLFRLLLATAVLSKADNINPKLSGDLMQCALVGTPLPMGLLQATVQRCCADQAKKNDQGQPVMHVSYYRAAIFKASLNRLIRNHQLTGKEITVSLDPTHVEPAYLLGRLFAAYERIQSDAAGRELNRSVRDTYFGAAMANPASVFPRLIQLNQHHMRDLRRNAPGLHVLRDRMLGEIWEGFAGNSTMPTQQPLAERARFALGYYHQRQAFFSKSSAATTSATTNPITTPDHSQQGGN